MRSAAVGVEASARALQGGVVGCRAVDPGRATVLVALGLLLTAVLWTLKDRLGFAGHRVRGLPGLRARIAWGVVRKTVRGGKKSWPPPEVPSADAGGGGPSMGVR